MPFEGYIDREDGKTISGWIWQSATPNSVLSLELIHDGVVVARTHADRFRQDVRDHGKGTGYYGFLFEVPEQLSSQPLKVRVEGQRWFVQRHGHVEIWPGFHHWFQHSLEYGLPEPPHAFSEVQPVNEEAAMSRRLIDAFNAGNRDAPPAESEDLEDVWTTLGKLCHQDILDLLRRGDADGLAACLLDMHRLPVTHGTTQGQNPYENLRANPASRKFSVAKDWDQVVSLAEAMGIMAVECAEQEGRWCEGLFCDAEDLIGRISAELGVDLVPPQVANGLLGVATKRGVVQMRDANAAYAAWRMRHILDGRLGGASICEIGAGLGQAAYYTLGMGARQYTMIDLPVMNVMQGYFTMKALPEADVMLYGEPEPSGEKPIVRVLPTWMFSRFGSGSFQITLNQDSFPEMHPRHCLGYLRAAQKNTNYLLSINQESLGKQCEGGQVQNWVCQAVKEVGRYRRIYRMPYWIRRGWVEELYQVERD